MGFKEDIEEIASFLPKEKQTFMFSATISKGVQQVAQKLLLPGHKFVDTVPENEVPTHMKIKQTYLVAAYSQQLILLHQIITSHMKEKAGGKIIVFFPTTKTVHLVSQIFSNFPGIDIIEMHSQLAQIKREKQAERFRRASSAIMFTTDVSARGVDYPGVTLVCQFGAPGSKDSYIHRVGRTGRAGNEGEAILILSDYDKSMLKQLDGIPIKEEFRFNSEPEPELKDKFKNIISRIDQDEAEGCYFAFLNYLSSCSILKLSNDSVIGAGREFAKGLLRLENIPKGSKKMQSKYGCNSNEKSYGSYSNEKSYGSYSNEKRNGSQSSSLYSKYKERSGKQYEQEDFRRPTGLGSSMRNNRFSKY